MQPFNCKTRWKNDSKLEKIVNISAHYDLMLADIWEFVDMYVDNMITNDLKTAVDECFSDEIQVVIGDAIEYLLTDKPSISCFLDIATHELELTKHKRISEI